MTYRNFAACMLALLLGSACATKAVFRNSPVVPAAEAEAKIKKDDNNNARIKLRVKHLAPPTRLSPPKAHYVVWAETPQGRTLNLGQLVVSDDLEGEFLGTTALTEFRLLISAEDLPAASVPSRDIVLSTEMLKP